MCVRACTVEREECGGVRACSVARKECGCVCGCVRLREREKVNRGKSFCVDVTFEEKP